MKPLAFNYTKFTELEADYLIMQVENRQLKARLREFLCPGDCVHHEEQTHKCNYCVRNPRRYDFYKAVE